MMLQIGTTNTNALGAAADWVKILSSIVAVAGFFWGLRTYRRSVKTRRAEWLSDLHHQFFETDAYSRVRRILDYKLEPDYGRLASAISDGHYDPLADDLYRYLNFFEFLAGLRDLEQITTDEITGLFDYDLRVIRKHAFITDALAPQGFEKLGCLLKSKALRASD